MLVLLSPAKRLNEENTQGLNDFQIPFFQAEAEKVNRALKKLSAKKLMALQHISADLALQNWQRNQTWNSQPEAPVYKEALYLFNGDAYVGLDAKTLSANALEFAKQHLRILSGMYGMLKPFDLIEPYRLEMGTSLKIGRSDNLYSFWKKKLTAKIKSDFSNVPVVNLASKEYSSSVDFKQLKNLVIDVEFKDRNAQGEYKVMSFYAKKARGMMLRFILENAIEEPEQLLTFNAEGYAYALSESKGNKLVFLRDH